MKHLKSCFLLFTLLPVLLMNASPVGAQAARAKPLTPIVIFPGWGDTLLEVSIHNQTFAPDCPRSGSFQFIALIGPNPDFSQICVNKMMTLVYKFDPKRPGIKPVPMNQPGVQVRIVDYGKTSSWPHGEELYAFLESKGYQRNVNIRVAGNDFRLTPDLDGWLGRTVELIEETYRENHNTPVHLVGFSNGPSFAQYLLTQTSRAWKNKYIQGFTPIVSNMPGAGGLYSIFFTGLDISTGGYPTDAVGAASSAAMYESFPATYMSANDPAYFGDREEILRVASTGKIYYAKDAMQLFKDAGLTLAQKLAPFYWGIPKFLPPYFPNVDTYAEKGSGIPTGVALWVPDLTIGQVLGDNPTYTYMDGDSMNEYLATDAVKVWSSMPCYRFEFTDNSGMDHFSSFLNAPDVWQRLVDHANQARSVCR